MKKTLVAPSALSAVLLNSAHAQSVEDLSQMSRESQIMERCAKLGDKAAQLETCRKFKPQPVVLSGGEKGKSKVKANPDDQVSITILSAWGVGDGLNCEVSINDSSRIMTPGETIQGWTLKRLDQYVAEFQSASGSNRVISYRTGPKPVFDQRASGLMPAGNPGPMPAAVLK